MLKNTSSEWQEYTWKNWSTGFFPKIYADDLDFKNADKITLSLELDNTIDDVDLGVRGKINVFDKSGNKFQAFTDFVQPGEKRIEQATIAIPEGLDYVQIFWVSKEDTVTSKTAASRKHMLNFGTRAAPWQPAPEDVTPRSEIDKIKQAIIALGGDI